MKYPGYQRALRNVQANPNLPAPTGLQTMQGYGGMSQLQKPSAEGVLTNMPQSNLTPSIQYLTPEQSQNMTQRWFPNGIPQGQFPGTAVQQVQGQIDSMQEQYGDNVGSIANRMARQRMSSPQQARAAFMARNNGAPLNARQKKRLDFLRNR